MLLNPVAVARSLKRLLKSLDPGRTTGSVAGARSVAAWLLGRADLGSRGPVDFFSKLLLDDPASLAKQAEEATTPSQEAWPRCHRSAGRYATEGA